MSKLDAALDEMVETGQWCVGKKLVSAVRHDDGIKYTFDDGSTQWWALVLPASVHKVALLEKALELCSTSRNNITRLVVSPSDWIKHAGAAVAGPNAWQLKEPIKYPAWLEEYKG